MTLHTWRTRRNLSKAAAARAVGLNRNTWIKYEASGEVPLTVRLALVGASLVYPDVTE
jgi:DNA-binding XRE family transcriptional regulator